MIGPADDERNYGIVDVRCPKCRGKSRCQNSRSSSDEVNRRKIPSKYILLDEDLTYRDCKCVLCGNNFQSIEVHGNFFEDRLNQIDAELRKDIEILVSNI